MYGVVPHRDLEEALAGWIDPIERIGECDRVDARTVPEMVVEVPGRVEPEWVPGYPLQYQLLRFEGSTLTVETRRREELNGAWKADARWAPPDGKDPLPRYRLTLV